MQEKFTLLFDERQEQEKQYHELIIDSLTKRNLDNFNITLSLKKKIRYIPSETKQIDLGDEWFCTITDNQVNSKYAIMTCHGCPGNEKDWTPLESEMKNKYRWINLVVPGFDGKDERRGNYQGTGEDLQELILKLMNKLGIQKVIGCGHSMGSFIWSLFLHKHPEKIVGFISVAGVVDLWYVGLLTFYNQTVVSNGLNKPGVNLQKLALDNDFREKLVLETNQRGKLINFDGVPFPQLKASELFAYTKLVTSFKGGISSLFEMNRFLAPEKLKLFLFSKPDAIEDHQRTQYMMFRRAYGEMRPDKQPGFLKKYELVRKDIWKACMQNHNVNLDIQNIQSNFIFHFPETGHNVHKRRPVQIAKILPVYITVLDQLQKAETLLKSRL